MQVHVHLWSFSCTGHAKNKEVYFLCCNQKARAAGAKSFTLWQQATFYETTLLLLVRITYRVCCSLPTSRLWCIALSTQLSGCNNIPSFLQWTARMARSFCKSCNWHHLHILVKAPLCFDWVGRASSAQSVTLWQQATIVILRRAHSISAYLCQIHNGVVLHAPFVRGESHIQHNAKQEIATLAARLGLGFLNWLRVKCKLITLINDLQSNLLKQHWAPFHSIRKPEKKYEISCHSALTSACKPMTRSDSTILVTRLWLNSTKSWIDSDCHLTELKNISDDSDSSFTRRASDSDSTNMTWAHFFFSYNRWSKVFYKYGLVLSIRLYCIQYLTVMESRDVSRDPFFQVSVSNVSGLVSVSKDLELLVSRLCMSYFFMKSCKNQLLENGISE